MTTKDSVREPSLAQPAMLPGLTGVAFGGDYYPEQWPEEVWDEDIRLMREARVNLVQVGIFSWGLVESAPGTFDFSVLDRALDMLQAGGIRVSMATPTAAPPSWFFHQHPQALPVKRDGRVLGPGARESYCPSSPEYRSACARFVTALAEHYQTHPAIVMWHVNNEFGVAVGQCYCERSAEAFRTWLRRRYDTLTALNEAWGTVFWGQQYRAWEEIRPPRLAPMAVNPVQRVDFFRFTTDEYAECCRLESEILCRYRQDVPIMTNFANPIDTGYLDYKRFAQEVDVVGVDTFLLTHESDTHIGQSLAADITRFLAGGAPWLVNEHSTGSVTWQPRNTAKAPGEMRRNTLANIARGADGALFFQWRASRFGCEKFHSAMVPQAGADTQMWRDVVALGADVAALSEICGSRVVSQAAVVWDTPSWWAMESGFQPTVDHRYDERVRTFYEAVWRRKLTADFVAPVDDLSGYQLVLVPSLYLVTRAAAANLRRYVEEGGTLVVSYFSGIVDEHDRIYDGPFPGALRDLLGLITEEFHPLLEQETVSLTKHDVVGDVWSERVVPHGATVVDTFATGADTGHPAVTRNAVGSGQAWYVATRLDTAGVGSVLDTVLAQGHIGPPLRLPESVEAVRRRGPALDYLFLINHDQDEPATVTASGRDILGECDCDGTYVTLPPSGVAVLRQPT